MAHGRRSHADLEQHLAACATCRAFAAEWAAVSTRLEQWEAPAPASHEVAAMGDLLVARFGVRSEPQVHRPRPATAWLLQSPAALAVPGAVAVAMGVATAPGWLQGVALGWFAAATVCALLVLLVHGRWAVMGGEGR